MRAGVMAEATTCPKTNCGRFAGLRSWVIWAEVSAEYALLTGMNRVKVLRALSRSSRAAVLICELNTESWGLLATASTTDCVLMDLKLPGP